MKLGRRIGAHRNAPLDNYTVSIIKGSTLDWQLLSVLLGVSWEFIRSVKKGRRHVRVKPRCRDDKLLKLALNAIRKDTERMEDRL